MQICVLLQVNKSGGPYYIPSYTCTEMIESKQNVHFIQLLFFSPKERDYSLKKSDSCDICSSLSLK